MHAVKTTNKIESKKDWLQRLADKLNQELPALRTKRFLKGKYVHVRVDHLARLRQIANREGESGIKKYCDAVVKFYNSKVAEKLQTNNKA